MFPINMMSSLSTPKEPSIAEPRPASAGLGVCPTHAQNFGELASNYLVKYLHRNSRAAIHRPRIRMPFPCSSISRFFRSQVRLRRSARSLRIYADVSCGTARFFLPAAPDGSGAGAVGLNNFWQSGHWNPWTLGKREKRNGAGQPGTTVGG